MSKLLERIISTITKMLDADRSTLFINDEKTNQLYTEVGEGLGKTVIRFPNHLGIAGTVFTTRKTLIFPTHMLTFVSIRLSINKPVFLHDRFFVVQCSTKLEK